jgi:hypothetical protein
MNSSINQHFINKIEGQMTIEAMVIEGPLLRGWKILRYAFMNKPYLRKTNTKMSSPKYCILSKLP